jgi:hypothetical protein
LKIFENVEIYFERSVKRKVKKGKAAPATGRGGP